LLPVDLMEIGSVFGLSPSTDVGYAHYGAAKAAYKQIAVIAGEQALKHMPHDRERRPPGRRRRDPLAAIWDSEVARSRS
jgi:hypothetical protein